MNALNEKGISKSLRFTARVVPFPEEVDTPEKKQELLNEAIKGCLKHHLGEDGELMKLFADFSFELAMNALVTELAIEAPEGDSVIEKLAELLKNL